MATTYNINYNDERFTGVEADKKQALREVNQTYDSMINQSDKYYQAQIDASKEWAETQKKNQQEQTDFTIEQIEQQKDQTKKDYVKEQSGAYVDWQKQSGEYGANAEQMAAQGMGGTGYSESAQVSMYNTYQNRVATARESYNRAVLNYDNAIKDARLQNNAALAEIAYTALQTQLELALEGFQYKNSLILAKSDKRMEVDNNYYNRYQDVLKQINTENAMAEEVRQYNESLAEEQRQYNQNLAFQKAKFAEEQRQFNALHSDSDSTYTSDKPSGGGNSGRSKIYQDTYKTNVDKSKITSVNNNSKSTKKVSNKHGDSWVEIPGHGRFSWSEVYAYVKDGTIKETTVNGKLKYTWVKKGSFLSDKYKNVTPDKKGYSAKVKELMGKAYN